MKMKNYQAKNGLGRMPPTAVDLEEAILGAVMLEKGAIDDCTQIINDPKVFYNQKHQFIFAAIITLYQNSNPIDILTVVEQLRKDKKIDDALSPYFIAQLTNRVSSASNMAYHCRVVLEKYMKRESFSLMSQTSSKLYDDGDVFEIVSGFQNKLDALMDGNTRGQIQTVRDHLPGIIEELDTKPENGLTGVPSGFKTLDRYTNGFQASDLIIIGARPGMGKTAFVVSMMYNIAVDRDIPVGMFSLEMSSKQIINRLGVIGSELNSEIIKNRGLTKSQMNQYIDKTARLAQAPIYIDDTSALSIIEVKSKARRMKSQHKIQLLIVDYLQLMVEKNGNREEQISRISASLKAIAKDLNIPVIALSQLNRAVETRGGDKKPQLSDLRDSGSIEQDADLVMFLYRAEYYGLEKGEDGNSTENMGEVILAKFRNGSYQRFNMNFYGHLTKWTDYNSQTSVVVQEKEASQEKYGFPTDYSESTINQFENEKSDPF